MGMIQQATTDAGAVLAVVCLALSFSATDAWSSYYYDDDDNGYYYSTYKSSAHLQAGKYTFLKYIFNLLSWCRAGRFIPCRLLLLLLLLRFQCGRCSRRCGDWQSLSHWFVLHRYLFLLLRRQCRKQQPPE